MKKTMLAALAIVLSAGSTVAFADGSPELGRPFGGDFYHSRAQASHVAVLPINSDADAVSRLQADGYRGINGLVRGSDGAWHGTALRGAAKVNVIVVPDGRIIAR